MKLKMTSNLTMVGVTNPSKADASRQGAAKWRFDMRGATSNLPLGHTPAGLLSGWLWPPVCDAQRGLQRAARGASNSGATMVMACGTKCAGPSISLISTFRKAGISRVRSSVKPTRMVSTGDRSCCRSPSSTPSPPAPANTSTRLNARPSAASRGGEGDQVGCGRRLIGSAPYGSCWGGRAYRRYPPASVHAQAGGGPGRVAFVLQVSRESNPLMSASTWTASTTARQIGPISSRDQHSRHRPGPSATISRTRHTCGTIVLRNRYWMAGGRHGDHQKRRGR